MPAHIKENLGRTLNTHLVRSKRQGEKILKSQNREILILIKHEDRHAQFAELAYKLPTHPTRTSRRTNIRRHRHRFETPVSLGDRSPESYALRAGGDRVAGVFHVGAWRVYILFWNGGEIGGDLAVGKQHGADAELAVGTVGRGLGGHGAVAELGEFGGREGVCAADLGDVGVGVAVEDRGCWGGHGGCLWGEGGESGESGESMVSRMSFFR